MRKSFFFFLVFLLFFSLNCKDRADFLRLNSIQPVYAVENSVTASDLISLINGMRAANGLGALSVDSALMACAQNTALVMAQNNMSWHIGDVSGRVSQFGYNNGNKAFATENFMVGPTTLSAIQAAWSDYDHMIPASNPSYCHIGAGVAEVNGKVYYVVQAAYPADKNGCGYSAASSSSSSSSTGTGNSTTIIDMSQIIASIKIATPGPDGKTYHVVENGQSLWSIATAYRVTIEDIATWNNIVDIESISLGQKLLIPERGSAGQAPTSTVLPTVLPTADSEGKYRHVIAEGETLSSIAKLWGTTIQELMRWNGIDESTTLGVGWKLFIPVTPTVTVPPTLTPLPSETPSPTQTLTMTPLPSMTPTPTLIAANHLPKASMKTYFIGTASIILLTTVFFFSGRYFYRRK